ncbi:MAG TPA: hypothetical protein VJ728_12540 [Candidatus Binataceae bacterium]|nr:hypothetical protein [Candidatus Binataceae bacterium]
MVSKCANPVCEVPFRYFHQGQLFRLETESGYERRRGMGIDGGLKKPLRRVEFYWLCPDCATKMTLVTDKEIGVTVRPHLALSATA